MKNHKLYEADDMMITIIRDNYSILQSLGSFGISLGFGDKTVREVCEAQGVDTYTFLAVVNYTINGLNPSSFGREGDGGGLDIPTLLRYLKASHAYFLDFQLPFIRRELVDAVNPEDSLAPLILKLYDEYAQAIKSHMRYEEKTVFPYVESLIAGHTAFSYDILTYSRYHGQIDQKLREFKSIIIKYLPSDPLHNNLLTAALYDLYNHEEWLTLHAQVEENVLIPAIRQLENKLRQDDVTARITNMISNGQDAAEFLSLREKEVVIGVVQGMTNKEIADHLCISTNTVITHRRNIARKLQIHSPAGLTIYAIVNNLVDISNVKL